MSNLPVAESTGEVCQLCKQNTGWGRPDVDEGLCKDHVQDESSERDALKEEFLELIETEPITIKKAADRVGRSEPTIWRWRQDDERFDERVIEALKMQQRSLRVSAVEDAVFEQIINGDAAAGLTKFWLKANGGEKWSQADRKHLEIDNTGGDELEPEDREKVVEAREVLSPREDEISFNGSDQ